MRAAPRHKGFGMQREYIAIALGAVSMALSFVPSSIVQIIGVLVGVAAFRLARLVKREDYRRDMPCTIAQVMGVAGAVLCAVAPILNVVGWIILWVTG